MCCCYFYLVLAKIEFNRQLYPFFLNLKYYFNSLKILNKNRLKWLNYYHFISAMQNIIIIILLKF